MVCDMVITARGEIKGLLADATKDVEKHLIRLPGLAQEEARRVRQILLETTLLAAGAAGVGLFVIRLTSESSWWTGHLLWAMN